MSRRSRTRDALRELGWGKTKAACYCALVEYGEMKASEIAGHTDTRQEKVYNPLKRLDNEGYIIVVDTNPKRYEAQNPKFVIDQERQKFSEDTDEILEDLEEAWARSREGMSSTSEYAHVLSGSGGLRTARSEVISDASDSLHIFDRDFALLSPDDIDEIQSLAEDGADVRVVSKDSEQLDYVEQAGAKVRCFENISKPSFYIADESKVLLSISGNKATVVFEDRYFTKIINKEFQQLYQQGMEP